METQAAKGSIAAPYTCRQLRDLMGQAYGSWYWSKRMAKPQAECVAHILDYRRYRAMQARGEFVEEMNERGNLVYRSEDADVRMGGSGSDRYRYDFDLCSPGKNWQQFDTTQDAWYFVVWVNAHTRQIFTYCEGDRILVVCPTKETFEAELQDAERCYGPPPPAFTVIDACNGAVTQFYETRPSA